MEAAAEEEKKNFNVYVGSERGILKGAYFGGETPVLKNFGGTSGDANNANAISCLNWSPVGESQQLIVGHQDGLVKFYNPKLRSFSHDVQLDLKSNLVGAYEVSEGNLAVGLKNGKLNVFNTEKEENSAEITTGQELSIIRQLKSSPSVFATGGKENDLKIYDISSESLEPTFKARNIPHDFLDLRVPVWVQDLTFVNESPELVSIVSRHGHLRLYDVKSSNRPVVNFQVLEDEALMAVADTGQSWQVVVGGNKGSMGLADIRHPGKGRLVHKFTAAAGSVRSIDFRNNYITACGLDRHLYLYNLYEKKAVKKLYLKTRLTKVIMTEDFRFGTGKRTDSSWQNIEGEVIIKKKKTC